MKDDLFSFAAANAAKRQSMAQVDANANPTWKDRMYECVVQIAKRSSTFTSDDIFELAESLGIASGTHDKRAFGPVMLRAAKAGICRKFDCAPVNSRRASRHAAPLSVWESLIVGRSEP